MCIVRSGSTGSRGHRRLGQCAPFGANAVRRQSRSLEPLSQARRPCSRGARSSRASRWGPSSAPQSRVSFDTRLVCPGPSRYHAAACWAADPAATRDGFRGSPTTMGPLGPRRRGNSAQYSSACGLHAQTKVRRLSSLTLSDHSERCEHPAHLHSNGVPFWFMKAVPVRCIVRHCPTPLSCDAAAGDPVAGTIATMRAGRPGLPDAPHRAASMGTTGTKERACLTHPRSSLCMRRQWLLLTLTVIAVVLIQHTPAPRRRSPAPLRHRLPSPSLRV